MLMMKLSSQSDGMTPFLTMSVARSATKPCTSITRRLQHFRYYSRGTSSFASFHLGDSFHHHLNIYMYGRANTIPFIFMSDVSGRLSVCLQLLVDSVALTAWNDIIPNDSAVSRGCFTTETQS